MSFDLDDGQRHQIEAIEEGFCVGRQFHRKTTGALMEALSYDLPMPKDQRKRA